MSCLPIPKICSPLVSTNLTYKAVLLRDSRVLAVIVWPLGIWQVWRYLLALAYCAGDKRPPLHWPAPDVEFHLKNAIAVPLANFVPP